MHSKTSVYMRLPMLGYRLVSIQKHVSGQKKEALYDSVLVDRFKSGDLDALTEITIRYKERVYGMVYVMLKNREDAEEITQDTFIRVWKGLHGFRGDSSLSTWVYHIAMNLARNRYWYWWRRKKESHLSLEANVGKEGSDLKLGEVIPTEMSDPYETSVTLELVERIGKGMDRLGTKQREILVLRNVKNMSYDEIAAILGISVGTVKSRIARAREKLRFAMGEE